MGRFIGAAGGIMMIALIVVLLWHFILDIGLVKDKALRKNIERYACLAAGLGLLQILIGALIVSFEVEMTPVFDIGTIWNMKPVTEILSDSSAYSFEKLTDNGLFPLYPVMVSVLSGILFDMYAESAFYISFLSGVVFFVCMGIMYSGKAEKAADGEGNDWKSIVLQFCVPGTFFLFLPCSFSLFMALFAVVLLAVETEHKITAVVFALLCCLTHISGVVAVVLLIADYAVSNKQNIRDNVRIAAITSAQLVVMLLCVGMGWRSDIEYWFIFSIPLIMWLGKTKVLVREELYRWVPVFGMLCCGLYLVGKINNAF